MGKNKTSTYNILKRVSELFMYGAGGKLWYEDSKESILYKVFHYLMFFLFYLMVGLEGLEAVFYEYPPDLHNDAMSFFMGHVAVVFRVRILIYYKDKARKLAYDTIKACELYEEENNEIAQSQYKQIKYAVIYQLLAVFSTMVGFTVEGIRRVYADGLYRNIKYLVFLC